MNMRFTVKRVPDTRWIFGYTLFVVFAVLTFLITLARFLVHERMNGVVYSLATIPNEVVLLFSLGLLATGWTTGRIFNSYITLVILVVCFSFFFIWFHIWLFEMSSIPTNLAVTFSPLLN